MSVTHEFVLTLYDETDRSAEPKPYLTLDCQARYDLGPNGVEVSAVYVWNGEMVEIGSSAAIWHAVMDEAENQLSPKHVDRHGRSTLAQIEEAIAEDYGSENDPDMCAFESAWLRERQATYDTPITL